MEALHCLGKPLWGKDKNREKRKMGEMKVESKRVRAERRQKCWLTGGMQHANHRGSWGGADVDRKLKVRCLTVPLKPLPNMHAPAIWTHMHSHPTSGTLPLFSSAMPPQMVPLCLASVWVACYDSLPVSPSALWMNYDPLPGLFNPSVFLPRQHLHRALPD